MSTKVINGVEFDIRPYANFRGADFRGADFRGADLRGADFRGADLRGADLRGADLWDADFRGADFRGADFRGADLRGADLRGANLWGANLGGANLGANLWGANLGAALAVARSLGDTPSGLALVVAEPAGWMMRVGCWRGTPDELRTLIEGEDWPEAETAEQRDERRPFLLHALDLAEWHIARNSAALEAVQKVWTPEGERREVVTA